MQQQQREQRALLRARRAAATVRRREPPAGRAPGTPSPPFCKRLFMRLQMFLAHERASSNRPHRAVAEISRRARARPARRGTQRSAPPAWLPSWRSRRRSADRIHARRRRHRPPPTRSSFGWSPGRACPGSVVSWQCAGSRSVDASRTRTSRSRRTAARLQRQFAHSTTRRRSSTRPRTTSVAHWMSRTIRTSARRGPTSTRSGCPLAWDLSKGAPRETFGSPWSTPGSGGPTTRTLAQAGPLGRRAPFDPCWIRPPAPDDHLPSGHGTMVAGIAAAATDNGILIAGVAWDAHVLPVKVMNAFGLGLGDSDIAARHLFFTWAADHGAEGDPARPWRGRTTQPGVGCDAAVDYAPLGKDAVVVAAAGASAAPDGFPGASRPMYPAAYPGVIAVSVDRRRRRSSRRRRTSAPWIDVAAPGLRWSRRPASPRPLFLRGAPGPHYAAAARRRTFRPCFVRARHPDWFFAASRSPRRSSPGRAGPGRPRASIPTTGTAGSTPTPRSAGPRRHLPDVPQRDALEPNDDGRSDATPLHTPTRGDDRSRRRRRLVHGAGSPAGLACVPGRWVRLQLQRHAELRSRSGGLRRSPQTADDEECEPLRRRRTRLHASARGRPLLPPCRESRGRGESRKLLGGGDHAALAVTTEPQARWGHSPGCGVVRRANAMHADVPCDSLQSHSARLELEAGRRAPRRPGARRRRR